MDKNLKKLSRVELLELMVSLSEDYEELADENNRLKKMLSKQRLPRSTKVGSIAEAALQANGYFEAAQRSADEYLREIKHLRDELAKRSDAQTLNRELAGSVAAARKAESKAQAQLRDAQVQANQVVARANSQADAIIAEAKRRAEETVANANRQAHAVLSQARQQVSAGSTAPRVRSQSQTQTQPQPQTQTRMRQPSGDTPRMRQQDAVSGISSATTGELASRRGRHSRAAVEGGAR